MVDFSESIQCPELVSLLSLFSPTGGVFLNKPEANWFFVIQANHHIVRGLSLYFRLSICETILRNYLTSKQMLPEMKFCNAASAGRPDMFIANSGRPYSFGGFRQQEPCPAQKTQRVNCGFRISG
ncbi:hypothetical protein ACQRKX_003563 [Enterobacter cloacae]